MDRIRYSYLQHLYPNGMEYLLKIYNNIWRSCHIPKEWKNLIIIPIRKPMKPIAKASGYRPIALLSCIIKTFEHLLLLRLQWWVEHQRLLSPTMPGSEWKLSLEIQKYLEKCLQTFFLTTLTTDQEMDNFWNSESFRRNRNKKIVVLLQRRV